MVISGGWVCGGVVGTGDDCSTSKVHGYSVGARRSGAGRGLRELCRQQPGGAESDVAELGRRSGVSQADISRIENGQLDARWSTIHRLSAALEAPEVEPRRSLANGHRREPPSQSPPRAVDAERSHTADRISVIIRHAADDDRAALAEFDAGGVSLP